MTLERWVSGIGWEKPWVRLQDLLKVEVLAWVMPMEVELYDSRQHQALTVQGDRFLHQIVTVAWRGRSPPNFGHSSVLEAFLQYPVLA